MPFTVDMAAVEECVRLSPEWRMHAEELAAKGGSYAQNYAPVVTGAYRASLYATVAPAVGVGAVVGAPAVRVGTTSPYGLEVEFQEPARHLVLLRTLDRMVGLT